MKWYYRWKLKRIQKEISQLRELSKHKLVEDYTPNSRLRILDRLEKHLQAQLGQSSTPPASSAPSSSSTQN